MAASGIISRAVSSITADCLVLQHSEHILGLPFKCPSPGGPVFYEESCSFIYIAMYLPSTVHPPVSYYRLRVKDGLSIRWVKYNTMGPT